jgi:anion transporter
MSAADTALVTSAPAQPADTRSLSLRVFFTVVSVVVPVIVWFAPFDIAPAAKHAMAISSFMIIAWMTNIMEYGAAGLIGCTLFWALHVTNIQTAFSGFVNDAPWFLFGAIMLGVAANKTGVPSRIGSFIVSKVGASYSRLLLGLIITSFALTFFVPSGNARLVIMAAFAISVIEGFGVGRGSNIGRGIFLVLTYVSAIFDKMIIAGAGSITAWDNIKTFGGIEIPYALWFAAFFPCAIITIFAGWWFVKWAYPPEVDTLETSVDELKDKLRGEQGWSPTAVKSAALSVIAIGLWMTDWAHHIPPSVIALALALIAFFPFVNVLEADDMKRTNLMPVFFVAAALSMSNVALQTGALKLLTDSFFSGVTPYLSSKLLSIPVLYWGGFVYHFATASEISMLATSLPVLMQFAKTHGLDVMWIGMIWGFSAGGKLFAYQSAPLVVGYSYGYFRHTDLIKIGAFLTVVEFAVLAVSAAIYWPFLHI